jgi:1-acyl-sn-glycerol-3-phosphate acyltransferase
MFAFLRSLFFTDPLIYLYTIVMGFISMLGSLWDSTGRFQHGCARIWARLILGTSGIRVRVEGLENFEPDRQYIFCSNHLSLMDTPVVFGYLPVQFRVMAKKGLFRLPFLGWHLRRSGHLAVDRKNPKEAIRSFEVAAQRVKAGTSMVFFPEGTRSRDGVLHDFKHGAFLLAIKAGVPVVPMAIRGTRECLLPDTLVVRSGQAILTIGRPISCQGMTHRDAGRLAAMTRRTIGEMLHEQTPDRSFVPAAPERER